MTLFNIYIQQKQVDHREKSGKKEERVSCYRISASVNCISPKKLTAFVVTLSPLK